MKHLSLIPLAVCVTVASFLTITARDAAACGGCFHEPQAPNEDPSTITAHRMILSISSKQTTLYDQIQYSGNPKTFAWVLPISGAAEIGLSADIMFSTLGSMTETSVLAPPLNCPEIQSSCYTNQGEFGTGAATPNASADAGSAVPPVVVTKEETVGPYETVQLHSTDPEALNTWLTAHGFLIPDDVKPIVAEYVAEHFDFLAMKLVPGAGVQSMRPVRVTTAGAAPILPLRMVAAGTGATVGITLWVVAEGRYEPQNFPWFKIDASDLIWDWTKSASNFAQLRADKNAQNMGRGWEVENSTDLAQSQIIRTVTYANYPQYDAGADYTAVDSGDAGAESPAQVRDDDVQTLFAGMPVGNVRVTRLRGDLSHAALTTDLTLQASADQSVLPLYRQVTKEANEPTCPIYQGCTMIGQGTRSQAQAAAAKNVAAAQNSGTSSCAASTSSRASSTLGLGALATMLGLVVIRNRRRNNGGKLS